MSRIEKINSVSSPKEEVFRGEKDEIPFSDVNQMGKKFESLLEGGEKDKVSDKERNSKDHSHKNKSKDGFGLKESDLASLILKNLTHKVEDLKKDASTISDDKRLLSVIREIVDKILVGRTGKSNSEEVRIMLKESVLPETEVRISKKEGEIHIQFFTGSKEVENLLYTNSESLQRHLLNRLGDKVFVEVNFLQSGTESETEGRSRQRRSVIEEMEDWKKA